MVCDEANDESFKDTFFREYLPTTASEICTASFLRIFFVSLDKSVLFHSRCLMLRFSEILILVCRKIFSAFCLILHETFSSSYGFPLLQEFNPFYPHLVLYDRKHFCSILIDMSNLWFLFHQKFPLLNYDLKNVLTKQFPKMQKQPFANVFRNRCSYKVSNIRKKISVLESLLSTFRRLKTYNFNKKETPTEVFSCEYHKIFNNNFLWNSSGGCFWV